MTSSDRLRIVVLGYVVRGPVAGMAWSMLHHLLGLKALGHEVWFLEDSDDYPSCVDPVRGTIGTDPSLGLAFAGELFERVGLGDRWAYHDAHTGTWHGGAAGAIRRVCAEADCVLNLAGVNPLRPWLESVEHRVLVDHDPVFTQIRHLYDPAAARRAEQHTAFFTLAENFGRVGTTVPDDGFAWQPTRLPIWLEGWPVTPPPRERRFTTGMQWESYPAREPDGARYGTKADSFEPYVDLPARVSPLLELVVSGPNAPRERLRARGWNTRDPLDAVPDPWVYREYVQRSAAEFTVAKHGYVVTNSGWFSERSAGYLASGRPVVCEETGFSEWLPPGDGVVSFSSADEAVAGIEDVSSRYGAHAEAARNLAEIFFDSRRVLASLLERTFAPAPVAREPQRVAP